MTRDPNKDPADPGRWLKLKGPEVQARLMEVDDPDWAVLKRHPEYSDKWVVNYLGRLRTLGQADIRGIFSDPDLRKSHRIRFALMQCRHTPPSLAVNLVSTLRWGDMIKLLNEARSSAAVVSKVVMQLGEVYPYLSLGERIAIARLAPRPLIRVLRLESDSKVLDVLFENPFFTYEDALFIASYPKIRPSALGSLAASEKWCQHVALIKAMAVNSRTPKCHILALLRRLSRFVLVEISQNPEAPQYTKRIATRLLEESG